MTIAVYPGSFDPFTFGHLDILERSTKLFDQVIVAVLVHPTKTCLFGVDKRVEIITDVLRNKPNVSVENFNGLVVDFCKQRNSCAIIRGLRAVSDYDYELQISSINKQLSPEIETIFLMSSMQYSFLSSSIAKEIAKYGGDVSALVPPRVEAELRKAYGKREL